MKKIIYAVFFVLVVLLSGYVWAAFRDAAACKSSCRTLFNGCQSSCQDSYCVNHCMNEYEYCCEDCDKTYPK